MHSSAAQRASVRIVEVAYRHARSGGSSWLEEVLKAAEPLLDEGRGVVAFEYDLNLPSGRWLSHPIVRGARSAMGDAVLQSFGRASDDVRTRLYDGAPPVRPVSELLRMSLLEFVPSKPFAHALDVADFIKVNAHGGAGRGAFFCAPTNRVVHRNDVRLRPWPLLADHLAAAARLRNASADLRPEAVFSSDARVLHAEGAAREQLDALRDAVKEKDRSWAAWLRGEPDSAAWSALACGRWSLIEELDHDGRRYILAIPNAPAAPDPRRLTTIEREIASLVATGEPNKLIADRLGMPAGTVAAHVHTIVKKLGVKTRVGVVNRVKLLATGTTRMVDLDGVPLAVVAANTNMTAPDVIARLNLAEREVATLAARGASNTEIANARGVSPRTIANQLASIFGKLAIGSRSELASIWPRS